MDYRIDKGNLERLNNQDGKVPDGCQDAVKFLLALDADVFWSTCVAVIIRMSKANKIHLKEIIADMLKNYPAELEEYREIEAQFEEYFKEMDAKVSLISMPAIEETDEP